MSKRGTDVGIGLVAIVLVVLVLGTPTFVGVQAAWGHQFFNSTEQGCDGSNPDILWCDDFEDGDWAKTHCDDPDQSGNDGWCGTIYYASYPDPQGTGFGRCGGKGAAGTDCTGTSHQIVFNAGWFGTHPLSTGVSSVDELYFRYYFKKLPGYQFGHEKILIFQRGPQGGTQFEFLDFPFGDPKPAVWSPHHQPDQWYRQNQGNDLAVVPGRWYYLEVHIKLGRGDGIFEYWMDDCGVDGLACTGPSTLRMRHTGRTNRPASSDKVGEIWVTNWGNAPSSGETYYDQIVVGKKMIGPVRVPKGDTVPPAAPTGLRLQ